MGRYRFVQPASERQGLHPVWRGIGCLLAIIIPIISYTVADLIVNTNLRRGWFALPVSLTMTLSVPPVNIPALGTTPPIVVPYFTAKLALSLVAGLFLLGVLSLFYAILYQASGGLGRHSTDAPPRQRRGKKRKLRKG